MPRPWRDYTKRLSGFRRRMQVSKTMMKILLYSTAEPSIELGLMKVSCNCQFLSAGLTFDLAMIAPPGSKDTTSKYY